MKTVNEIRTEMLWMASWRRYHKLTREQIINRIDEWIVYALIYQKEILSHNK